jgi:hypothetical protein
MGGETASHLRGIPPNYSIDICIPKGVEFVVQYTGLRFVIEHVISDPRIFYLAHTLDILENNY